MWKKINLILICSITTILASGFQLIENGGFDGEWKNFHAPKGWITPVGNHRVLGSRVAKGYSAVKGLALNLQQIWQQSTVPTVTQGFHVPAGTSVIKVTLYYRTAKNNFAYIRVRTNNEGTKGKVYFWNGSKWTLNSKTVNFHPDKENYTQRDMTGITTDYTSKVATSNWSKLQLTIPVLKSEKYYAIDLAGGGEPSGDNETPKVWFDEVTVNAIDSNGKLLKKSCSCNGKGSCLNVDAILAKPPKCQAVYADYKGQKTVLIDGKPNALLGWGAICNQYIHDYPNDNELKDMVNDTNFSVARLIFLIGDRYYDNLVYGEPSWLSEGCYNWSFLDQQLARLKRENPKTKVMLQIILDGAKWWSKRYPHETIGDQTLKDTSKNVPDFLSPQWKKDYRDALRQMVAHVQQSPYADMIIGYTLFNGAALDCFYETDVSTHNAKREFRTFLKKRYNNDLRKLKKSWGDPNVTFENATCDTNYYASKEKYPLLFAPANHRRSDDSREFFVYARLQFMHDFAKILKEATHGKHLVGFRNGELLYGHWAEKFFGQRWGSSDTYSLLKDPNVDFYEQWEPYPGRKLGDWGTYAPTNPPHAFQKMGKFIVRQNDIRTHVSDEKANGYTRNLKETIAQQKKVMINSLVLGMKPYLFQMSFKFNMPGLLPIWRKISEIYRKSFALHRRSVAETAIVLDPKLARYVGRDLKQTAPSRGFALLEYPRYTWGRGGAAYDMIFKNQVPNSKYKVYIFFHTLQFSREEIKQIHKTLKANNAVAVFVWAPGIIDENQKFSLQNTKLLTGMNLSLSEKELSWRAVPVGPLKKSGFMQSKALGVLDIQEPTIEPPNMIERVYPPTLIVTDQKAKSLGVSVDNRQITVLAQKQQDGWISIFSNSPILAPGLLRYVLKTAGGFEYLESDDALYVNSDFIGVSTKSKTHQIKINLPKKTALYEVFRDRELSASNHFCINVEPFETYFYFRGTKKQWEKLK